MRKISQKAAFAFETFAQSRPMFVLTNTELSSDSDYLSDEGKKKGLKQKLRIARINRDDDK